MSIHPNKDCLGVTSTFSQSIGLVQLHVTRSSPRDGGIREIVQPCGVSISTKFVALPLPWPLSPRFVVPRVVRALDVFASLVESVFLASVAC